MQQIAVPCQVFSLATLLRPRRTFNRVHGGNSVRAQRGCVTWMVNENSLKVRDLVLTLFFLLFVMYSNIFGAKFSKLGWQNPGNSLTHYFLIHSELLE